MRTLQNRIVGILIVFAVVLVGSFVAVQLSHELKMLTHQNIYKARITTMVLEEKWENISESSVGHDRKLSALAKAMKSFRDNQLISEGYVFDSNGHIIVATERKRQGEEIDPSDYGALTAFQKGKVTEAVVDRDKRIFSLYVPLPEGYEKQTMAVRMFFPLGDVWVAFRQIYQPSIVLAIILIVISIFVGAFLAKAVIRPIRVFNEAAKKITSGRLDLRIEVHTQDELEELADTFNAMTLELKKMRQRAEDANPLTKLPGNVVIQDEIEQRIEQKRKFTVIYADLDNFKAFNDKYGVGKGDEAITLVGDICKRVVSEKGGSDGFVGHEGGDDFILITDPAYAEIVAYTIIAEFDLKVRGLYDKEASQRGFIVSHSRTGEEQTFPIMTISLAGVSNQEKEIASYSEVTNFVAEVKKNAKTVAQSCFVMDIRMEG